MERAPLFERIVASAPARAVNVASVARAGRSISATSTSIAATAAVCCETFLELNDAELRASDVDLYPIHLALAEGALSEHEFGAWLRKHVGLASGHQAHERHARYARR